MMSNLFKLSMAFIFFYLTVPAFGQSSFFVKAGGGLDIAQLDFTDFYNRPAENGIPSEQDESLTGFRNFMGSIAGGFNFPDSFSLFASAEWFPNYRLFPGDWAMMANCQFGFWNAGWLKPYLSLGLGVHFSGEDLGPASQVAVGNNFDLSKSLALFLEARVYTAFVFYSNNQDVQLNFNRFEFYTPVIAGLKYNL